MLPRPPSSIGKCWELLDKVVTRDSQSYQVPVALIVYRRPELTAQVLDRISNLKPKKIYVIADGPKNAREDERVLQVRRLIDSISWECQLIRIYSDKNLGLRKRVITGLDEVFRNEEQAIILEDDCLPDPTFFTFAAELLDRYKLDVNVSLVSGYVATPPRLSESYFFTPESPIWGWATWARTWHEYREISQSTLWNTETVEKAVRRIPSAAARRRMRNFVSKMSSFDSWAIEFAAVNLLTGKVAVVPGVNLVQNIGFGQDSTHTKFETFVEAQATAAINFPLQHPTNSEVNTKAVRRVASDRRRKWFSYPLIHPVEFVKRVWRFVVANKNLRD